jgi:outer membrane protein assembly factor BamE (lipoprotein component of BamABCDE complex)
MMTKRWISLALLTAAALHGCSASMGRKIDEAKVTSIQKCKTTEKELLAWFGEPSQRGNQNGLSTLQWMYVRQDSGIGTAEVQTQNLVVTLSRDGRVSEFALNPTAMPAGQDTCSG